ncbi:hypothetical protein MSG28_013889 [Choristoneura fumiferana]|uniref:Uncharacterized protein n=1 Tax=Choristoneura fumiferana TaxID=7141 RepID=A0ACC0K9G1_CHOFU|nr:hypothetical protein MSG28_013889 [Choristoneura fumiferana]
MCLLYLFVLLHIASANEDEKEKLCINNIANTLVTILDVDKMNATRLEDLQDKLEHINNYVIDKDLYAEVIINETIDNSLNQTNFYKSLMDEDQFRLLMDTEPKSLYLKLKEKMNRDDILKLVNERNQTRFLATSARRMDNDGKLVGFNDEEVIDEVVDNVLGTVPTDFHKRDESNISSIYWDPQQELEDLRDFHNHDGRRIFRGERTSIRYYPFMVSVHVMGRFWCGGALYWHDLVLTSASCLQLMHNNRFFRENPKVLQVRIGSNHSRISGEMVDALEVYFHPAYNPRTLRNNIAVIRLRYRLFFNYHRTPKIIQISHLPTTPAPTSEVLVMGWGVTKHDAGGPAVIAGQLVGIISFGPTVCGYPNAPTVFTLVGAFADWIEQVNETMPNYYRGKARTTSTTAMVAGIKLIIAEDHAVTEEALRPIESGIMMEDKPPSLFRARSDDAEDWAVDD